VKPSYQDMAVKVRAFPLHRAVFEKDIACLSVFKNHIDEVDNRGNSPLMLAVKISDRDRGIYIVIVRQLLRMGADALIKDKNG